MQFLVFEDLDSARRAESEMNGYFRRRSQFSWGELIEHPVEMKFAVPFGSEVAAAFSGPPPGRLISEGEAYREGFHLGPLNGRFYPAIERCQEGEALVEAFADCYSYVPFPVARALFLGALGAFYSAKCQIEETVEGPAAKMLPGTTALQKWWADRTAEIQRTDGVLKYLHVLYNTRKHGKPITGLKPTAQYRGGDGAVVAEGRQYLADAMGTRVSAEGVFQAEQFAPGYERWHPVMNPETIGFADARFTFELVGLPATHLGANIASRDPVSVLRLALAYYWELVRGAIEQWNAAKDSAANG